MRRHLGFQTVRWTIFAIALLGLCRTAPCYPVLPKYPAPDQLGAYIPLKDKAQAEAFKNTLERYRQLALTDLPEFIKKYKNTTERPAADQYLLQSLDGRNLLFLTEAQGKVKAAKFYTYADAAKTRLDPQASYGLEVVNEKVIFTIRTGQTLALAQDKSGKFHLEAFTNLPTPDSVFKIYWQPDGRVLDQQSFQIKKQGEVKIPSNEFITPYQAPPTLEGYSMPGDVAVASALEATYKAIGEDLREICEQVKSGKAKFEKNYEGRAVARTASPDGKRVVGFALDRELKKLSNGGLAQYDRIPEIPESVTRQSTFMCQVDHPGLANYTLRTPEMQTKVIFDDSHRLRNFTVYLVKLGQTKEIYWNEKGEIYTPGEQLPEAAK